MQTRSGRHCLRYGLAEHELDDVDAALHQERQDHAITDLAPAGFRFRLLFRGIAEAVHCILEEQHDLAQQGRRHMLLDVLGHVLNVERINYIIPYTHPFRHPNPPF